MGERMAWVISLAQRNVAEATGGPFSAAVVERHSGRIVAVGVNLVTSLQCSMAHAEMVALLLAERELGRFRIGAGFDLLASTEPCTMCLGAVCWSGVDGLACSARDADARAIGFDEGPKPADWCAELTARGVRVTRDVQRPAAVAVLSDYHRRGGVLYNGRG